MDHSIIQFFSSREAHSCGYCKSADGNISDGMWAHSLTVQDYQDLIDRGWRRSGQYCYKPKMELTCCPAYTIKCDSLNFQLSKSQKKILKRMRKFLIDGIKEKARDSEVTLDQAENGCCERMMFDKVAETTLQINTELDVDLLQQIKQDSLVDEDTIDNAEVCSTPAETSQEPAALQDFCISNDNIRKKKQLKSDAGIDPTKPLKKKAKLVRKEKRERKLLEKAKQVQCDPASLSHNSEDANSMKKRTNECKSLEDFLYEPLPQTRKHDLVMKLVSVNEVEVITMEWPLFSKYQMSVHHDSPNDCDYHSFQGFLVASPFKNTKSNERGIALGSFHQQYWLDGELIAVGVLDILPRCVSSVYFFYDPVYSFLSLGTYSSLREVALTRELNRTSKELQYYYMGFYIHSCPKMRYKSKMTPSYLLCPEVYTWHPISLCLPSLDENKYSRLHPDPTAQDIHSKINLDEVLILWKKMPCKLKEFTRLNKKEVKREEIVAYARLVGDNLASRLLYYYAK